jgi:cysteine desulfurase
VEHTVPAADADRLLERLPGLAISTGSACNIGQAEPSHVLMALDVTRADARGTLRISLGRPTTEDEVDTAAHALRHVLSDPAMDPIQ